MRTVAVLANGPSLKKFWPSTGIEDYELVIGCNTAAWLFPVDVWCVLDPVVIELAIPGSKADMEHGTAQGTPLYNRTISIPESIATFENMKGLEHVPDSVRMDMPWYGKSHKIINKPILAHSDLKSCNFTFPNALVVAQVLSRGGQVDVYGMDISTEPDVCGKWGDRAAGRWKRELPWIAAAWRPEWRIFGNASQDVRDFLKGKIPFTQIAKVVDKYKGGKTERVVTLR